MECVFCDRSTCAESLGEFGQLPRQINQPKLQFHSYCLVFSSDIGQNPDLTKSFFGFESENIAKALLHAKHKTCIFCEKTGASLKCFERDCQTRFHLPCALASRETLHLHFDAFQSYCSKHISLECIFDYEPITGIVYPVPCCNKVYSHDQCLKYHAVEAKAQLKCPCCLNVDEFRTHMRTHLECEILDEKPSYDVPDDNENDFQCSAVICLSPQLGRFLHSEGTEFHLILCQYCGSDAIHRICGQGRIGQNDEWTCNSCTTTELVEPSNTAKRMKISGSQTKRSEEKMQFCSPPLTRHRENVSKPKSSFGSSFEILIRLSSHAQNRN